MKKLGDYLEAMQKGSFSSEIDRIAAIAKLSPEDTQVLETQLLSIVDLCSEAVADILGNNYPQVLKKFFEMAEDMGNEDQTQEIDEHIWEYVKKTI
jgi:DNA-directed RNA polymerase subunit F